MIAPAAHLVACATAMGVPLDAATAATMVAFLDRLACEPQNLTAIDPFDGAVERHLADSLSALALADVADARSIADLGSGGGFPGIPLAIARPDCAVTLVESERRKAGWLARAAADLPNVRVVADRSEALASSERESFHVATARAVAPLPTVVELAAPLAEEGGLLVVWRGSRDPGEEERAARVADAVGLRPEAVVPVTPFAGAHRHLHTFRKVAPTPGRFPRRPGRAAKRPLA